MVISKVKNFCFVHNPRTGGTSIRGYLLKYGDRKLSLNPNAPVWKIQDKLDDSFFKGLFKFAFVRNPWSRLVSLYHYARSNKNHFQYRKLQSMNFKEFVIWKTDFPVLQTDFLSNKEGIIDCQFVGKFERLTKDFEIACKKIGIMKGPIGKTNQSRHKSYRSYFDKALSNRVLKAYEKDIDTFGYKF